MKTRDPYAAAVKSSKIFRKKIVSAKKGKGSPYNRSEFKKETSGDQDL